MRSTAIFARNIMNDKVCLPEDDVRDLEKVVMFDSIARLKEDELRSWLQDHGRNVERMILIFNPVDPSILDGFILLPQRIGFFHYSCSNHKGLSQHKNREFLQIEKERQNVFLQDKVTCLQKEASEKFLLAKQHYDVIRDIYQQSASKAVLRNYEEDLLESLLSKENVGTNSRFGKIKDQGFFGTHSFKGPHFLSDTIYQMCDRRILLKGDSGEAKGHLLDRVISTSLANGMDVRKYHCPFYTEESDVVYIPALNTAVVDSMEPHLIEPISPRDIILQLDDTVVSRQYIMEQTQVIKEAESKYSQFMRQGILVLKDINKYMKQWTFQLEGNDAKSPKNVLFKRLNELI